MDPTLTTDAGMVSELRWILLGAGALLILGLWLWESLRARRKPIEEPTQQQRPPLAAEPPRFESPRVANRGESQRREPVLDDYGDEPIDDDFSVPTIRVVDDLPPLSPPVVDLPEGANVRSEREMPLVEPRPSSHDRPRVPPTVVPTPAPAPSVASPPVSAAAEPPVPAPVPAQRTAPKAPSAAPGLVPSATPVAPSSVPRVTRPEEPRQPALKQKILALRLVCAGPERFKGAALRAAFESEGLSFGRYNIFHREIEDGQALFSIASLVEPGSFDLNEMPTRDYPGVSLFAVLPGAIDGPRLFDELIATARRLADRLNGQLQDERRQMLTGARVLQMREEVEAFEQRTARIRQGTE
jgi:cell division protein ZipA